MDWFMTKNEIYDRMFLSDTTLTPIPFCFWLGQVSFPHPLLKMLIDERVVDVMTSDYLSPLGDVAKSALAGIRRMIRNPAVERAKALGTLKRLSVFEARLEGMTVQMRVQPHRI